MIPSVQSEISESSYRCDYVDGKARQIGKDEKWVAHSPAYQRVVQPWVSIKSNSQKLFALCRNALPVIKQLGLDGALLGLPEDGEHERLHTELVTYLNTAVKN